MLFNEGSPAEHDRDLTARVDMLSRASPDDRSAILRSIPAGEGSRVLQAPDVAGGWLKDRLLNLSVMYRATQAISHVLDTDALLPQILELVFDLHRRRPGRDPAQGRRGEARPQGRPLARRGRPRRADVDLADDRRPRARARARGSSPPTPPATSGSAPRSRSSITASARRSASRPGAARHPGRPLRRHPHRQRACPSPHRDGNGEQGPGAARAGSRRTT